MNISDEAVEAAARAESERDRPGMWEHESESFKDAIRRDARLHLEAAAPYIAAEVWDEGWLKAHSCDDPAMAGIFFNPYRSQA